MEKTGSIALSGGANIPSYSAGIAANGMTGPCRALGLDVWYVGSDALTDRSHESRAMVYSPFAKALRQDPVGGLWLLGRALQFCIIC